MNAPVDLLERVKAQALAAVRAEGKPVWDGSEPFPYELAVWNWTTILYRHFQTGAERMTFLGRMRKHHGEKCVLDILQCEAKRLAAQERLRRERQKEAA